MIVDNAINTFIDEQLLKENAEREAKHTPSGKLSASMLFQPVRFQVLKTIGVPRKPIDPFVLGKFDEGNDAEAKLVARYKQMDVLIATQRLCTYRDAIGYVDAVIDSEKLNFKQGEMPHEIKSAANMKLKRIKNTGVDWHYKIQACFYVMALGSEYYAVDVVSYESSAYVLSNIFKTSAMASNVDKAITAYDHVMIEWRNNKTIPPFEPNPEVKWTGNKNYAMFDEKWIDGDSQQTIKLLEEINLV